MLVADRINKSFPTPTVPLVVLRDISLSVSPGEMIGIKGPSGSGKSTLLSILGAIDTPTSGSFRLDDEDPFVLGDSALARFRNRMIGFIFQDHHLLPQCTALENVLVPTLAGPADSQVESRANTLLERVGLADRAEHRPAELSGGQRQRVAIARALINRPRLVLADEPTGNLDRASADQTIELIRELQRDEDFLLVLVTHSDAITRHCCRVYTLVDGQLNDC